MFKKLSKIFGIVAIVLAALVAVGTCIPIVLYIAWLCAGLPFMFGCASLAFAIVDIVKNKNKKGLIFSIIALAATIVLPVLGGIAYFVIYAGFAIILGLITAMAESF